MKLDYRRVVIWFFIALFVPVEVSVSEESTIINDFPRLQYADKRDPITRKFSDPLATKVLFELNSSPTQFIIRKGDSSEFYLFGRSGKISLFDMAKKKRVGGYSLATENSCPQSWDKSCGAIWWKGRWSEDELLESEVKGNVREYYRGYSFEHALKNRALQGKDFVGCLRDNPVRIGDFNNDKVNEFVVMIEREYSLDWLIFSSESHKTIFSTILYLNDAKLSENISKDLVDYSPYGEKKYQYWLNYGIERQQASSMYPGVKSFAKMYMVDFDGDNSKDLIVWRKQYKSLLASSEIKGFTLEEEMFGHYEFIDGEFRLQTTSAINIDKWLADNELTWQKGYPSISECPGQEGQLIPEMHDPLLNDPEVLQ